MTNQLHDIRDMIPRTDQTNPGKFPHYEFRAYPKMMTMLATKEYIDAWLARNEKIDDRTNKPWWPGGRPKVGQPVPILDDNAVGVVVHDEDEEEAFRADHPEAVQDNDLLNPEMQRIERERSTLESKNAALEAEIKALKAGKKPEASLVEDAPVRPKARVKASLPKALK